MANIVFITNEDNWKIIKEKNVMGIGGRGLEILPKIEVGDKCIIYIKGKSIFKAIYEITLLNFDGEIKWNTRSYPKTISLKPIKIAKKPLYVKDLLPELKFIKIKANWSIYFRFPKFLPDEDLDLIASRMEIKDINDYQCQLYDLDKENAHLKCSYIEINQKTDVAQCTYSKKCKYRKEKNTE